jgi:hypothetical protein
MGTTRHEDLIRKLRALSFSSLKRMYDAEKGLFHFRLRRTEGGIVPEGHSVRYTAIVLIGFAREDERECAAALGGQSPRELGERLLRRIGEVDNPGDLALILWAATALALPGRDAARQRLEAARPAELDRPTVETAWALTALSLDREARVGDLRERLAARLTDSFNESSGMFPHLLPAGTTGLRAHVACFADLVYPIQALALYHACWGAPRALEIASRCAETICRLQGEAGQWWWHYDRRTGDVVEGYPVYAVHQDSMAPMALFDLKQAGGPDFAAAVLRGLAWLERAPELGGGSLIDERAGLIWRKVARREPGKASRAIQAVASRVHPRARVPIGGVFPPTAIDYEDRPYHLGWVLYAWPAR